MGYLHVVKNCFGWKLLQERLPTRGKLRRRVVIRDIHQQSCVFFFEGIESASHLFVNCAKTQDLGANSQFSELETR